jgi:hypothetical protein
MRLIRLPLCRSVLAIILAVWTIDCSAADPLLIDDFSIDQAGYSTGRDAAFAPMLDARLFAGGREIWGGGANNSPNCAACTVVAGIHSGIFEIVVNDIPSGTGNVTWPVLSGVSSFNISEYSFLTFDVVRIEGTVDARLNLNLLDDTHTAVSAILTSVGPHSFRIPDGFDKRSVKNLGLSFLVDRRQTFAISSVELIVPEPQTASLAIAIILAGCVGVRWRCV